MSRPKPLSSDVSTGHDLITQSAWRAKVRRRLLTWFERHARDLPWRREPTLYHVWISEVMLQQTQVATVVDYYNRFIAAFPTVSELAAADEEALMRLWEGLGYYRRARMMHQAAKQIDKQHAGSFPSDYQSVLALPGIGRYTAGAILSIATDARLPILEGNTMRVFSRWVGLRDDVKSKAGSDQLWTVATAMLPQRGSGQFNQAAMELGALVCKPVAPLCRQCPVASACEANRLDLQDKIPGKVTKTVYQDRREYAFLIPTQGGATWLIHRVPVGERWAGLWDFPRVTDGFSGSVATAAKAVSTRLGIDVKPMQKVSTIKHAVTRFRITLEIHVAQPVEEACLSPQTGEYRFAAVGQLSSLPLSVTGRKIVQILASGPAHYSPGAAE